MFQNINFNELRTHCLSATLETIIVLWQNSYPRPLIIPLFASSIGATWFVFLLPVLINHFFVKDKQFKGSINLAATLLVTYPLCGVVPVVVMLCKAMWLSALGWLVAFPLMTIFAYHYMRWAVKMVGYARLVLGDKKEVKKLAVRRAKLYKKLREILK